MTQEQKFYKRNTFENFFQVRIWIGLLARWDCVWDCSTGEWVILDDDLSPIKKRLFKIARLQSQGQMGSIWVKPDWLIRFQGWNFWDLRSTKRAVWVKWRSHKGHANNYLFKLWQACPSFFNFSIIIVNFVNINIIIEEYSRSLNKNVAQ